MIENVDVEEIDPKEFEVMQGEDDEGGFFGDHYCSEAVQRINDGPLSEGIADLYIQTAKYVPFFRFTDFDFYRWNQ